MSGLTFGVEGPTEPLGAVGALIGVAPALAAPVSDAIEADAVCDKAAKRRASSAARCSDTVKGFSAPGGPMLGLPDGPVGVSFFAGFVSGSLPSLAPLSTGPETERLGPEGAKTGFSSFTWAVSLSIEVGFCESPEDPASAPGTELRPVEACLRVDSNLARSLACKSSVDDAPFPVTEAAPIAVSDLLPSVEVPSPSFAG